MADLTNAQITAGAAVLCDHGQPIGRNAAIEVADAMQASGADYTVDDSELARKIMVFLGQRTSGSMEPGADPLRDRLAERIALWRPAPSPQIAEKVELPSIDSAEFRQKLRTYHDEASYGSLRVADNNIIAYIDGKVRDAIAASRRSPSPQVADIAELPVPWPRRMSSPPGSPEERVRYMQAEIDDLRAIAASRRAGGEPQESVLKFAIDVEKTLCRALGREWSTSGISIETLIAELAARSATPAPASAGQAKSGIQKRAWSKEAEMMESWAKLGAGQAAPVLREVAQMLLDRYDQLRGERPYAAEFELLRNALAAQPAEGAGQAGQVATCTCPSGDGSLRWPCPQHPPESPTERTAAPAEQASAQKGGEA